MEEKLAHKVREIARELKEFTLNDIATSLHVQSYREKENVRDSLKGLKRIGELTSIRPGFYRYRTKDRPFSMLEKMWRAMRIKGSFTRRDIGRLSGASITHIHKYFMFLEKERFIVNTSGNRSYEKGLFELLDPDNAPLNHPKMPPRKKKRKE